MTHVLDKWRSLSVRARVLIGVGTAAVVAGSALAGYLVLKRDADVECPPPCGLEVEKAPPPKRQEQVKTVNWPVYGYDDQRTRYLSTTRVRPPYDASEWSFNAGKLLEFSPVVADGVLYFQDKNSLFYALDADTGKVRWKNEIGDLAAASPAYSDGRLFAVTLEPGNAVALRARDGKVLWERPLPGRSETSPVVFGDKVIVGSESGDVFALDTGTGKIEWQVSTAGNVKGGLALDQGTLYGANYAGEVFAIRASSGEFVWQSSTQGGSFSRGGPVYSTPAVAFGRVFLGSIDGRVYSFDADSGELVWSHSTGDWVYPGPAVADTKRSGPTVYIGSKDQNFYALDAETGEVRWQKDVGGIVLGAASVLGEVVYVGVIGPNIGSFGFDVKTGRQVFESELGEYNPVISDGERLYLTGAYGIRAFEHETKAERKAQAQRLRRERERRRERQRAARERRETAGEGAPRRNQGGGPGAGDSSKPKSKPAPN